MDTTKHCTQAQFADLIGTSQQAVSDLIARGVLQKGASARDWNRTYCARLREVAAGRASTNEDGLDLAAERARLARAQSEYREMLNAKLRGELVPVVLLEQILAKASGRIGRIFDGIPARLRREVPGWSSAMSAIAQNEISKVCAIVAGLSLADLDREDDDADTV